MNLRKKLNLAVRTYFVSRAARLRRRGWLARLVPSLLIESTDSMIKVLKIGLIILFVINLSKSKLIKVISIPKINSIMIVMLLLVKIVNSSLLIRMRKMINPDPPLDCRLASHPFTRGRRKGLVSRLYATCTSGYVTVARCYVIVYQPLSACGSS